MRSIAYVASTLPIALLDARLHAWGIVKVLIHGRVHLNSYNYLKKRHPQVDFIILPDTQLLKIIIILFNLLSIKIRGREIYFFHECCCPVFDLLVKLIKPRGHHYPQVTLQSFIHVRECSLPGTRLQRLMRLLKLHNLFDYYMGEADNNAGHFIIQKIKNYPSSVQIHQIFESRNLLQRKNIKKNYLKNVKRILILCGRDVGSDQIIESLYRNVVNLAIKLGYSCDIKDHPAAHARLNFKDHRVNVIDPAMPVEFVIDQYTFVFGMGSTGLLYFSERGVSLLRLLACHNESSISRRIAHLSSMPDGVLLRFPGNVEELEAILIYD